MTLGPGDSGESWLARAELPYPLCNHMVATVEDSSVRALFVFGGRRTAASPMEKTCLRYSPTSNRWSQVASMHYARGIGQAVTLKGRIYVLGGCTVFGTGLNRAEVYDPAADTWHTLATMPESLHDFSAAAWRDSLIFLFGGGNWSPSSPPQRRVWMFNPATGVWDTASPLPTGLGAACCGIVGDTVYLAGGWTEAGPTNAVFEGVIKSATPRQINWYRLDTLPARARCRLASGVAGGIVYVAGGILDDGTISQEALAFDPRSRTWSQLLPKPSPVAGICGSLALGSRLYFPGGFSGVEPYLARHDCLDVGRFTRDAAAESIISPAGRLEPGAVYPVNVSVINSGIVQDTVSASARILDTVSQQLLFQADTQLVMDSGQTQVVDFGEFIPPAGGYFIVTAAARSLADSNPDNDTARQRCRTVVGSEPDGYGYVYKSTQEPDGVQFEWLDPSGGTFITDWEPNPDDGVSMRSLPFAFPYYGDTLQDIYVCTDGFLETSTATWSENRRLPFVDLPNIIAPFWDDLTLRERGSVVEKLTPDAAFYTWSAVPRYGAPQESLTFQVVLQRSGRIQFNYLRMAADRTSSTVGIQGQDGSWNRYLGYVYDGRPQNHVPADSVTIVFSSSTVGISETPSRIPDSRLSFLVPSVCAAPSLTFSLAWSGSTAPLVTIFDVTGCCIRVLRPPRTPTPNQCSLLWDLTDDSGRRLPQGTYLMRASAGPATVTRKLVLLR